MLQKLRPISEKHSIFRSVATLFVPQNFLKPEDIFDKCKDFEGFKLYPKKSLAKPTIININNNSLGISNNEINGFLFENYSEKGSINNIFKLENKDNRAIISLETRNYTNWQSFKQSWFTDLINFSQKIEFYVDAISLSYRDEFIWEDPSKIPVDLIFDVKSELLNKKFIDSRNGSLILISQGSDKKGNSFEERTEISFNNDLKRIVVEHQFATKFNSFQNIIKLIESDKLDGLFDNAHSENKSILKDIFTKEVQEIIDLS